MSKNKVAVVTGATKRVGASFASTLLNQGYDLAITYRGDQSNAIAATSNLSQNDDQHFKLFHLDLEDNNSVESLIERVYDSFGRLDLLVNNASLFYPPTESDLTCNTFLKFQQIHLAAPAVLSHRAAKVMNDTAGGGTIINMLDIFTFFVKPSFTPYTTSKAALYNLTRQLAYELAPTIRVNAIAPGAILEPVTNFSDNEKEALIEKIPLKRFGSLDDLNKTLIFLTETNYITGEVIMVDGGRTLRV
ncbi:MAG: SDR family oxidoreductase [Nitrospinota bacterium]